MTEVCPSCGSSHTKTVSTDVLTNGTRRRRRTCKDCSHRWTTWDGERPEHRGGSTAKRGRPITPDEVWLMLTNHTLNHNQMAERLDLHPATVRNVRLGNILTHCKPELARWVIGTRPTRTCDQCCNWKQGECGYGFPDLLTEGYTFAADCELFSSACAATVSR